MAVASPAATSREENFSRSPKRTHLCIAEVKVLR